MPGRSEESPVRAHRRVARELGRLEALAARQRLRVRLMRALRGSLGAGATLAALIKLKIAGSLGLKIGLALLVGAGLAWPFIALGALALLALLLSILSLFSGDGVSAHDFACDWPCDCKKREKRAARLKQLIEVRQAWLAAPSGGAPRRDPVGNRRSKA
ncbi:hypothetical protein [Methylobacterium iners]|uniref:Phage holin family protein n=1 Tax=Methylobacterium iners TaxID=418707 RepID=A0ABQ4RW29_9HYPH|nr:hypothetical protein [Methylobacterium iners]GJD94826.1 hypothetical protein OCOJLMKI_2032 [Methylobacterium iners]